MSAPEPTEPKLDAISEVDLLRWFTEAPESVEQLVARQTLRKAALDFARAILKETLPGPAQRTAVNTLRDALVWACFAVKEGA